MKKVKLSIITVSYNSEKYIKETIESVLNQSFKNYEYIIIDGGSEDKTLEIIEEYLEKFEGKLCYISEKDNGIYDAMNKGITIVSGDIIGIINSDDYYTDGAFQKVADAFSIYPDTDVVYSDMIMFDNNGQMTKIFKGDCKKLNIGMLVNHPTCFVARQTYEKYGSFDRKYKIVADYDLMLRIYYNKGTFSKIDGVLAMYRCGGASWNNINSVKEKYEIQRKYYSFFHCAKIWLRGILRCYLKPLFNK